MPEVSAIREAIVTTLPAETSGNGRTPAQGELYVPPGHAKALRLDCQLVVGTRGVGKSVWTAALGDPNLRASLGSAVPDLARTEVGVGFAERPDIDRYPDADTFSLLLRDHQSLEIWKTVIVRWLDALRSPGDSTTVPRDSWPATVQWVKSNPEAVARLAQSTSEWILAKNQHGLIVFDALDRSSQRGWKEMDSIVRGLLQAVLWLMPFPGISGKVFLREDQYGHSVASFPDASKLAATQAELTWARHDLHGLLWQILINGPAKHGESLRSLYENATHHEPIHCGDVWLLEERFKRDAAPQRALFETLAGPWMGRDKRRGVPYVWAVGHLADGKGQTSPRSFLAAIRQAAEDSGERYSAHTLALHYESIKRGIQKASEIRVNEMAEDYPWVPALMAPLQGMTVPGDAEAFRYKWEQHFPDGLGNIGGGRLPPRHDDSWVGVREDLERIGVFTTRRDGRMDMPDLYRVGFELGRRGGVKPRGKGASDFL